MLYHSQEALCGKCRAERTIEHMRNSDCITIKNNKIPTDKPNEDCFRCDDASGIYIVMDGVTRDRVNGIYPNPSPAAEVTELATETLYTELLRQKADGTWDLHAAMMHANKAAADYNQAHPEVAADFEAGCVGVVCIIDGNTLQYACIGDCIGKILMEDEFCTFTENQTAEVTKHKKEFTAREIRHNICNNSSHPCGYGVLNGLLGAEDFVRTGIFQLSEDACIFLSSDGCEAVYAMAGPDELKTAAAEDLVVKYTTVPNAGDRTFMIIK